MERNPKNQNFIINRNDARILKIDMPEGAKTVEWDRIRAGELSVRAAMARERLADLEAFTAVYPAGASRTDLQKARIEDGQSLIQITNTIGPQEPSAADSVERYLENQARL